MVHQQHMHFVMSICWIYRCRRSTLFPHSQKMLNVNGWWKWREWKKRAREEKLIEMRLAKCLGLKHLYTQYLNFLIFVKTFSKKYFTRMRRRCDINFVGPSINNNNKTLISQDNIFFINLIHYPYSFFIHFIDQQTFRFTFKANN